MEQIFTVLGVLTLGLLFVDVFYTVFHPQGHGGPLHVRQNRLIWRAMRRIGRHLPNVSRAKALVFGGPVMAVCTLGVWAALLVLGFAMIYFPWIDTFLVNPQGRVRPGWAEAIYYSGYTASSLGIGDLVADHTALRLATAVETLSGLALVSVAVSYIISVYGHQGMSDTLALEIATYLGSRSEELLVLDDPVHLDALGRRLEHFTSVLLQLLQAYAQYPILHYFRSADPAESLTLQMGRLLHLASGAEGTPLERHPSLPPLRRALDRYLQEVETGLIPRSFHPDAGEPAEHETIRRYTRLLRYLGYG